MSALVNIHDVYARERDLVRTCLRYMTPLQHHAVREQIEALDQTSPIWCRPEVGPSGASDLWNPHHPVRELRHA